MPKDVRQATTQLTAATQAALQSRCSRMDVELPPGISLGVESAKTKADKANDGLYFDGEVAAKSLLRSDRELARLFVEMFSPLGKKSITVAFTSPDEAEAAQKIWGKDTRVMSLQNSAVGSKKKKAGAKVKGSSSKGFAAKLAAATAPSEKSAGGSGKAASSVPEGTEVLLVVAPKGEVAFNAVQTMSESVGMGCCIVLLNARLEGSSFVPKPGRL